MSDKLFERASREAIVFDTPKGAMLTSDLWKLPLSTLNSIAVDLFNLQKDSEDITFLKNSRKSREDDLLKLKFDVAKYILDVRQEEIEDKRKKSEIKEQQAKIQELIEQKEAQALDNLTIEELQAKKAALSLE